MVYGRQICFSGTNDSDRWVGPTVKINPAARVGAQGLRIGIYPKANATDTPRRDDNLNLIRLPLPYDGEFMELYYQLFHLVRAFLKADGKVCPRRLSSARASDERPHTLSHVRAGEPPTRR